MHQSSINHPLIIRDVERFNFEQCNTTWNNNFQMNIGSWPEFQAPGSHGTRAEPTGAKRAQVMSSSSWISNVLDAESPALFDSPAPHLLGVTWRSQVAESGILMQRLVELEEQNTTIQQFYGTTLHLTIDCIWLHMVAFAQDLISWTSARSPRSLQRALHPIEEPQWGCRGHRIPFISFTARSKRLNWRSVKRPK